jgi:RNA polymerase sigma-70 factor, ECF subfamily
MSQNPIFFHYILNVQIISKNLEVVMDENDRFIIRQCLDGRPDEFRHLIRRYQYGILAFITGKLKDRTLVEEAAQETFVRAYFNLSNLHNPDKLHSWLIGIADRVAKEMFRDRKKVINLDCLNNTPDEKTGSPDEAHRLEEAVALLEEPYRQVALLRFYSGQSCQQIAESLDVPIGTVTKQLSRAYEKLRNLLQDKKI